MAEALVSLLIVVIVIAIVVAIVTYAVNMLPVEPNFKNLIMLLVYALAAIVILFRALPLLGVHV